MRENNVKEYFFVPLLKHGYTKVPREATYGTIVSTVDHLAPTPRKL